MDVRHGRRAGRVKMLRYAALSAHPRVFKSMTGLAVGDFDALVADVLPALRRAEYTRRSQRPRQRAVGGGHPHELSGRDQILLTVVWLRQYPMQEVLAYLFGVSDSTVSRVIRRVFRRWSGGVVVETVGRLRPELALPPRWTTWMTGRTLLPAER